MLVRRLAAALAASALIVGLLGPTPAIAVDTVVPTCNSDTVSVNEDDVLNGGVTCSGDEPGDLYDTVSNVSDGVLNLNANNGSFSYTPNANFFGSDAFSYHLTDPDGDSLTETITITITPVNDAPSFTKGANQSVAENSGARTVSGWATSISEGPNESSQTVSFTVTNNNSALFSTDPAVSASGTLTFTPAASQVGSATVSVSIKDNGGTANGGDDTSAVQTFTISVTGVNDPPSFNAGADQTDFEDAPAQSVSGWATAISPGPPDESGQAVTFVIDNVTNSSHFSTQPTVSPAGTLTYTPAADANGASTVTLHAHDNGGGGTDDSPTQTFTITLTAVNDAPSFTKGADQSVAENSGTKTVSGWASSINEGPNESSQTVSFTVTNNNTALFSTDPAVSSSGTLTFTPTASQVGSATVSVSITDNGGTANGGMNTSGVQTFTISVTGVNDPPSFNAGADQTDLEDAPAQSVSGWATAISPGPPDESGQAVTFVVTNNNSALFAVQPAVSSGGTLTYKPALNANGIATVSLHAHDNGGGTADSPTQTFAITITAVNDPPTFTKGADQADGENAGPQSVAGWATAISKGPANESSQTVSFTVTNTNNALFSVQPAISSTGTLTYTPATSKNGAATVSVQLLDNGGTANSGDNSSALATFTITVSAINDPPSFVKGADQTDLEDAGAQSVPAWATAINAGPPDEVAQTLTFVVVSDTKPTLFSVPPAIGPTGILTYSLAPNANGSATIGVELHDNGTTVNGGDDTSAIQTFKINVTPQNDAPTCIATTAATFVGTALTSGLVTACTDLDLNALTYSLVSPAGHGTATVNPNGSFTYTPEAAFQGNDTFTFKANDGTVDSNVVSMGVLVSPDPIAKNDVAPTDFPTIVQGSGATVIPVLLNDQDKQGGPLTIISVTQGTKGTVAITGGGTGITYDPTGFAAGTDSFRYTISDNQSRTNSATVVIVISRATPTGSLPTARIVSPTTLGATTAKLRIAWTATSVGTGLKTYQLQESYNGGRFKTVRLVRATSTSSLRTLTFGKSYSYRLKVTDTAGNVSPWATIPTIVVGRAQETTVGIVYSGPWGLARSVTYSGGKSRWARAAGASATFSFNGQSVAWVSSKGRSRGSAQVLVDGVLVKTVSLFASRTTARQVAFSATWPTKGLHTIQIVVLGTPGRRRVDVDTFVVAR